MIQIGYALGLALLVPLGDLLERRRLMVVLLGLAVVGMAAMAAAPGVQVTLTPTTKLSYPSLIASVGRIIREEPVLRLRMLYGALAFGALGPLAAKFAGRLADRGLARIATGGFLATMAASYILLEVGGSSIVALGAQCRGSVAGRGSVGGGSAAPLVVRRRPVVMPLTFAPPSTGHKDADPVSADACRREEHHDVHARAVRDRL